MEQINDIDGFIEQAGFVRSDGTVLNEPDEFLIEDLLFDPDKAQVMRSKYPHKFIWTLINGDDGGDYLTSGCHYINRMGYMFTTLSPKDDRLSGHFIEDCTVITWWPAASLLEVAYG